MPTDKCVRVSAVLGGYVETRIPAKPVPAVKWCREESGGFCCQVPPNPA